MELDVSFNLLTGGLSKDMNVSGYERMRMAQQQKQQEQIAKTPKADGNSSKNQQPGPNSLEEQNTLGQQVDVYV